MAPGLPLLLGKSGGDDLFLSSCYHDGETLTDLQIPQGVIFLTASNPVFFFLNITYRTNKKQVWGWNTTLTHLHISPLSQWWVIWCHSSEWEAILKLYHDLRWSLSDVSCQVQREWKLLLIGDLLSWHQFLGCKQRVYFDISTNCVYNACGILWISLETNDLPLKKKKKARIAIRMVFMYGTCQFSLEWEPQRRSAPLQQSGQFNMANQKQTAWTDWECPVWVRPNLQSHLP